MAVLRPVRVGHALPAPEGWGPSVPAEAVLAAAASAVEGPGAAALSPVVLEVVHGRPRLEHVPGPKLAAEPEARSALDAGRLAATGAVLARLHTAPCPLTRPARPEVPPFRPVLPAVYYGLSEGQRQLLARLHRDGPLREQLRRIFRAAAAGSQWCHADARPDNVCVGPGGPQLVDWERSGLGRPEMDVGVMLASLLGVRLARSVPDADSASGLRSEINSALRIGREDIGAVLEGYDRDLDAALLAGVVGASLVTRAYTRAAFGACDRAAELMYGVGTSLVTDPQRWQVLGGTGRGRT